MPDDGLIYGPVIVPPRGRAHWLKACTCAALAISGKPGAVWRREGATLMLVSLTVHDGPVCAVCGKPWTLVVEEIV